MNCWLYNKDLSPIWLDTDNMLVKLYAGFYWRAYLGLRYMEE
jgi:hypothetical protein